MFNNPFSFEGRIRRTEYGISLIIYSIAYAIVVSVGVLGGASGALVFLIPMIYFLWAQGAKRCHDLGNSGWFQLIPFYFFWLLFAPGENEINNYGPNPKGIPPTFGGPNITYNGHQNITEIESNNQPQSYGGYDGGHNRLGSNEISSNEYKANNNGYESGDLYK